MVERKRTKMRESRDGKTVGISLRIDKKVLRAYSAIAARANSLDVVNGGRGGRTAQDVMRHQLTALPLLKHLRVK